MKALLDFIADAVDLLVKFAKSFFTMVVKLFQAVGQVLTFFTSGDFRKYFPSFVLPLIVFVVALGILRLVLSHGKGSE